MERSKDTSTPQIWCKIIKPKFRLKLPVQLPKFYALVVLQILTRRRRFFKNFLVHWVYWIGSTEIFYFQGLDFPVSFSRFSWKFCSSNTIKHLSTENEINEIWSAWFKIKNKFIFGHFNPLSVNPTKWSNTLKQFVANLPTNCFSVFGYFVKLGLKRLNQRKLIKNLRNSPRYVLLFFSLIIFLEWISKVRGS